MPIYTVADMLMQNAVRPVTTGAIEVNEDSQGYTVKMVVPGIAPEHIEVTLTGRTLTIKAEAINEEQKQDERRHVREFAVSRVARRIEFPLPVDPDGVNAHGEHGILTVRVPKSAVAQPKRIAVNGVHQITE
ncbi:MAG: Hsp20/alpha crystallin family protein [Roseiflexaceae bacterium]|jgi:HSP20 family protein